MGFWVLAIGLWDDVPVRTIGALGVFPPGRTLGVFESERKLGTF